jgi:hypothetical protein
MEEQKHPEIPLSIGIVGVERQYGIELADRLVGPLCFEEFSRLAHVEFDLLLGAERGLRQSATSQQ